MEETTTQSSSSCVCADKGVCAGKSMCHNRCCGRKHLRVAALIVGFIFALAIFAWCDKALHMSDASYTEKSMRNKVQAVFLSNGQVYFGNLSRSGFDAWRLTNAHYLERSPDGAPARIKKLAEDMHMPENTMYISNKNILFWQNLQNASPITQGITDGK